MHYLIKKKSCLTEHKSSDPSEAKCPNSLVLAGGKKSVTYMTVVRIHIQRIY